MRSLKPPGATRRVLISGMFDMQNYGDLLFPLVARFRLERLGIEVVPVAPTARSTGLADAIDAIDIAAMLTDPLPADGVLIGGGYIIHNHQVDLLDEYRIGDLADWAGPGLWFGATLAGALRDIPIVWNGPGVPHPFPRSQRVAIDAALRAADYVSVRDRGGAALLAAPDDVAVLTVPDPIADLARMWPIASLKESFKALLQRKELDPQNRHMAIHVRNRSLGVTPLPVAAARLSDFAKAHGLIPILIALGRSHEDDVVAHALSQHIAAPHIVLDDAASLREVAAAIAHSDLYLGASLHGYITAAAYGVPGVLVARPAYRKFAGFLEHTQRPGDLVHDWDAALRLGATRLGDQSRAGMPDGVLSALDDHWERIADALSGPETKRAARADLLRTYLRFGTEAVGPGWLHRPLLPRAAASPTAATRGMADRLGLATGADS